MYFFIDDCIIKEDGTLMFHVYHFKNGSEVHKQFAADFTPLVIFTGSREECDKYMIRLANRMNAIDLDLLGEELQ